MASPLPSAKATVDLSAPRVKGSRIRRDPPQAVKELSLAEIRQRDQRNAIIGIILFTLVTTIVLWGLASIAGWTPRQYIMRL